MLKNLKQTDIKNKTILYRAPYDIETAMIDNEYEIKDTSRIDATIETLKYLLSQNCKIAVLTWVGRPLSTYEEKLSTKPHAKYLSNKLQKPIKYINDCYGEKVIHKLSEMKGGEILMLENVRFHKEENESTSQTSADFAKKLCQGYDLIVFDGFPQAHREAPSTTGILQNLPSCAGFYFEKEYNSLNGLLSNPQRPFTLIIGGAKISDKVDAINNLYDLADIILVGGGASNAFLKAEGKEIAESYIEDENAVKLAKDILNKNPKTESYKDFKVEAEINLQKVIIPYDLAIGSNKEDNISELVVVENQTAPIPHGMMALDIGPVTQLTYQEIILQSKTVFWAGPLGVYENPMFAKGTASVVKAFVQSKADTIIAGGDTIDAYRRNAPLSTVKHASLAGGATLEFVAGKTLPVIKYLNSQ